MVIWVVVIVTIVYYKYCCRHILHQIIFFLFVYIRLTRPEPRSQCANSLLLFFLLRSDHSIPESASNFYKYYLSQWKSVVCIYWIGTWCTPHVHLHHIELCIAVRSRTFLYPFHLSCVCYILNRAAEWQIGRRKKRDTQKKRKMKTHCIRGHLYVCACTSYDYLSLV